MKIKILPLFLCCLCWLFSLEIYSVGHLGIITKTFITDEFTLSFGEKVFVVGEHLETQGENKYHTPFNDTIYTVITESKEKLTIPSTYILLFELIISPNKNKFNIYNLSSDSSIFIFSEPKIENTSLPVNSIALDKFNSIFLKINNDDDSCENCWVKEDNIKIDENEVYKTILQRLHIKIEESAWEFRLESTKVDWFYENGIQYCDEISDTYLWLKLNYARILVERSEFELAEDIYLELSKIDIRLSPLVWEEFQSNIHVGYSAHISLLKLYGENEQNHEKLKQYCIQYVPENAGISFSGFEWNTYLDYQAVTKTMRFLENSPHLEKISFLKEALNVADFPFTREYIINSIGNMYFESADYQSALDYFEKVFIEGENKRHNFFKTGINQKIIAIRRIIFTKWLLGLSTNKIYLQLLETTPDISDSTLIKYQLQQMEKQLLSKQSDKYDVYFEHLEFHRDSYKLSTSDRFFRFGEKLSKQNRGFAKYFVPSEIVLYELPHFQSDTIYYTESKQEIVPSYRGTNRGPLAGWNKIKILENNFEGWVQIIEFEKLNIPSIILALEDKKLKSQNDKEIPKYFVQVLNGEISEQHEFNIEFHSNQNKRTDRSKYSSREEFRKVREEIRIKRDRKNRRWKEEKPTYRIGEKIPISMDGDSLIWNPDILTMHYNDMLQIDLFETASLETVNQKIEDFLQFTKDEKWKLADRLRNVNFEKYHQNFNIDELLSVKTGKINLYRSPDIFPDLEELLIMEKVSFNGSIGLLIFKSGEQFQVFVNGNIIQTFCVNDRFYIHFNYLVNRLDNRLKFKEGIEKWTEYQYYEVGSFNKNEGGSSQRIHYNRKSLQQYKEID